MKICLSTKSSSSLAFRNRSTRLCNFGATAYKSKNQNLFLFIILSSHQFFHLLLCLLCCLLNFPDRIFFPFINICKLMLITKKKRKFQSTWKKIKDPNNSRKKINLCIWRMLIDYFHI